MVEAREGFFFIFFPGSWDDSCALGISPSFSREVGTSREWCDVRRGAGLGAKFFVVGPGGPKKFSSEFRLLCLGSWDASGAVAN